MTRHLKNLPIILALAVLCGCAGKPVDDNTVTVWHWMSDREDAFVELASRFEKETGIKIKFELFAPSEAYAQRVKASAQTQTLPDVYGILGEKRDAASFIRSGYVANLTPELEADGGAWKKSFFEKALAVNEFAAGNEFGIEPGFYGVPLDATTIQMVYNKKLYEKAGLDPNKPPKTWDEFIGHCSILKERGIPIFVSGFGEIWMIDAMVSNLAMNLMGQEKVFNTYRGKVSYTDHDWVKILGYFKQMADEGFMVDGTVTMVNKIAEQTFANERAAFAFNGSWCVNVYKGMNPDLSYGAIPPPSVNPRNPMRVWGGAGTSFVINQQSPRGDKALQFLKWMTQAPQQTFLASATENLPANKDSVAELPPILAQFADDLETVTHPSIYPVHESPSVSEAFNKGVQSILIGEKRPDEVAAEVQKVKDRELSKKN